jgi:hypothetical protein
MVQGIPARLGRLNEHAQILTRRALADKFVQRLGAQRSVQILRAVRRGKDAIGVGHFKPSINSAALPATITPSKSLISPPS